MMKTLGGEKKNIQPLCCQYANQAVGDDCMMFALWKAGHPVLTVLMLQGCTCVPCTNISLSHESTGLCFHKNVWNLVTLMTHGCVGFDLVLSYVKNESMTQCQISISYILGKATLLYYTLR